MSPAEPVQRRARRLLIVGWDAADWMMIDRLWASGAMPRLRRLVDAGLRADLASALPRLSPLLWSTIATGVTPDRHGILNFVEPNPDPAATTPLRLASSTSRRVKALWNVLTQAGLRTHVVSWYASHPAEPLRGVCVSNMLQEGEPTTGGGPWPTTPGLVHPREEEAAIAAMRVGTWSLGARDLQTFIPRLRDVERSDARPRSLAKQLARTASVHAAAISVLSRHREWDCAMVFYEGIDTIGHLFMEYLPPRHGAATERDVRLYGEVMPATYRLHDRMLGELLDLAGPDTTVLLLSDHGFHSDHRRPVITAELAADRAALEASWHRETGILVLSGPGIARGASTHGARLVDVAPTAMALLGVPVGKDLDGRPLAEAFHPPCSPDSLPSIASWETEPGDAGQHPADLRLDPFEAHDALRQLVDLGYMADPSGSAEAQLDLVRRETEFNRAVVFSTTGRSAAAAEVLAGLVREKPEERRYVESLSKALLACARSSEATAVLRAFIERSPDPLEPRLALAGALLAGGDEEGATKEFLRLRQQSTERDDLALGMGELATALGRLDEAQRFLQQAKSHDPSVGAHLALCRLALARSRFETAGEHALDALEIDRIHAEANLLLGVALAWIGDLVHARTSLELALAREPGLIEAGRFLAAIDRRQGRLDDAERRESEVRRRLQAAGGTPPPPMLRGAEEWDRSGGGGAPPLAPC